MEFIVIASLLGITAVLILIDFLYTILEQRTILPKGIFVIIEFLYIVLFPLLFQFTDDSKNDCCSSSAFFSPDHRLTIYILIISGASAYFWSSVRENLSTPVVEVIVNCLLLIAIGLNSVMIYHHSDPVLPWFHAPIILLLLKMLVNNQILFINEFDLVATKETGILQKWAIWILRLPVFVKFPAFILLCLPLLLVLTILLLLFGQKPDSAIRAFTDTYKHGFSQLDYQCEKVICPNGHFLCSVAAKGHRELVKPLRQGERGGITITCNRQLLISNAFEELLQQLLPSVHKPIRNFYNRIGSLIHKYYGVFNYKWVSDIVYLLMKPLEFIFLFALYTFDKKPEDRIARQYLGKMTADYLQEKPIGTKWARNNNET